MDSPDSMDELFDMRELVGGGYKMNLEDDSYLFDDIMKNELLSDYFLNPSADMLDLDRCLNSDTQPVVQSEHSYSVTPPTIASESDLDFDAALLNLVNPNLAMMPENTENINNNLDYTDIVANSGYENTAYHTINANEINYSLVSDNSAMQEFFVYDSTESESSVTNEYSEEMQYLSGDNAAMDYVESLECGSTSSNDQESVESFIEENVDSAAVPIVLSSNQSLSSLPRLVRLSNVKSETSTPSTIVLTYQPNSAARLASKTPTIIVTKPSQPGLVLRQGASVPVGFVRVDSRHSSSRNVAAASRVVVKNQSAETPVVVASESVKKGVDTNLPPSPPNSDSEGMSPKSDRGVRGGGMTPLLVQRHQRSRATDSVVSILSPSVTQQHRTSNGYHVTGAGRLILSDEERRTLIAEGYPVPTRLPLSKQDEMNLKKVQRKIKNKMSAQESRRKKKDYLDTLEKKLEISNQENQILKKQLESLQSDNRTLQAQITKLQTLANKLKPSIETSTCIMVFALFFAMFTSTFWSPPGLSGDWRSPWAALYDGSPAGELGVVSNVKRNEAVSDVYTTPNKLFAFNQSNKFKINTFMKSRTLMSTVEDPPDTSLHHSSIMFPSCYLLHWFSGKTVDEPVKPEPLSTVQPPNHPAMLESRGDHIVGTAQTPSVMGDGGEVLVNKSAMMEGAGEVIVYATHGNLNESSQEMRTAVV